MPLHKVKRRWSDRTKIVEVPLFNSYIFVNCPEHRLRELLLIPGISRIVYYLGKPAVVRDSEIEAIKDFLQIAHLRDIITNGDDVEIICGPFEKHTGKVIEKSDKWVKLFLEEIGAKICVSLLEIDKKKSSER